MTAWLSVLNQASHSAPRPFQSWLLLAPDFYDDALYFHMPVERTAAFPVKIAADWSAPLPDDIRALVPGNDFEAGTARHGDELLTYVVRRGVGLPLR